MPIQFTCPVCRNVLSVPDAAAGSKARCPVCNSLSAVPSYSPARPDSAPQPVPYRPPGVPPAPHGYAGATRPATGRAPYWKVLFPALGMIAGSTLSLIFWGYRIFVFVMGIEDLGEPPTDAAEYAGFATAIFLFVFSTPLVSGVVIACSSLMLARRAYPAAIAAAIVSLAPCQFCCLVTLPFGIWAVVSLLDPDVRAMFR